MKFAFHRQALCISTAATLLAGCGGAQSPIGVPGAIAPDSYAQKSLGRNAHHATSVHYVYVTNAGSNYVSAFAIKASGALKQVLGSPFAVGTAPSGLAIDPTGAFLYVVNSNFTVRTGSVSAFAINTSSGALTPVPGSPFAAGEGALEVAIDPSGKFVYVTNHLSNTVSAFAINTSSGALTQVPGSPFTTGKIPVGVAVDPTGKFVYVTNSEDGDVSGYAINRKSGALRQVKGSPFPTGYIQPWSVAIDGTFVYVVNNGSDNLTEYVIAKKSGALTRNGDIGAGSYPIGVAVDPTGKFLYVSDHFGREVLAYAINASDGLLTSVGGYGSGFRLWGLAIDPTDKFLYVVGNAFNSCHVGLVRAFGISAGSGVLSNLWKGSSGGVCASRVVVR